MKKFTLIIVLVIAVVLVLSVYLFGVINNTSEETPTELLPTEKPITETTQVSQEDHYQELYSIIINGFSNEFYQATKQYKQAQETQEIPDLNEGVYVSGEVILDYSYNLIENNVPYYALFDVDNNGTKELILGSNSKSGADDEFVINSIWSLNGDTPVNLFYNVSTEGNSPIKMNWGLFGARAKLTLYDDGHIMASNAGMGGGNWYYKIAPNGYSIISLGANSFTLEGAENYDTVQEKISSIKQKLTWEKLS